MQLGGDGQGGKGLYGGEHRLSPDTPFLAQGIYAGRGVWGEASAIRGGSRLLPAPAPLPLGRAVSSRLFNVNRRK